MAEVTKEIFDDLKKSKKGIEKFRVVSDSMTPLIQVGDTIVVAIGKDVKKFDIIAFWGHDRLICHILWHKNAMITSGGEVVYQTCSLKAAGKDLAIKEAHILGPVMNFQLTIWQKLRLAYELRSRAR